MKPIKRIPYAKPNNQEDSEIIDISTGKVTSIIKKGRNSNIKPYYIRVYPDTMNYHKMISNLPYLSCHKLLAFIMWCLRNTMIKDSDIVALSYSIYINYTDRMNIKPISQPMYYKSIKILSDNEVIKHTKDMPKGFYKVNFLFMANGKYNQEDF